MAMQLNFSNIFKFMSLISPFLIIFFLVTISIFNQDIKGIIYLSGILISVFVNVLLMNMIKSPVSETRSTSCELFDLPFGISSYDVPYSNSVILAFTMAYLIIPMIEQNNVNYSLFGFIFFMYLVDGYTKVIDMCTKPIGVFLGGLIGLLLGTGWYYLIKSGNRSLVYFDELTSNDDVKCSKPSKQRFVCNVYKNGELVKRL
jgi:hypothetical protein